VVLFELKANIFTQFCVGLPLLGIKNSLEDWTNSNTFKK
jgi:hypothetical protein